MAPLDIDKHEYRRHRRSLSPREQAYKRKESRRSRSPHHRHTHDRHSKEVNSKPVRLPYEQTQLRKRDLDTYRNLFAGYLDIQKQLDISELSDDEVKGRWKSFINKWNAGTLAQGWYDPARLVKANDSSAVARGHVQLDKDFHERSQLSQARHNDQEEEDDYGPGLPTSKATTARGPTIPETDDLQYRREQEAEQRQAMAEQHRYDRKQERKAQDERLNELVPRADPGSRERQREKKQDIVMTNRAFADAKDSGAVDIPDSDLMGDDGVDAYKAKMKAMERQKNERELRKEENLRARAAEREERLAEHRRKEEKTMEGLRALAQQRYG